MASVGPHGLEHSELLPPSNIVFHILSCFPYVKDIDVGMDNIMMLGKMVFAFWESLVPFSVTYK